MFNDRCGLTASVIREEKWKTRRDAEKVHIEYERGRKVGDFPTLTLKEYALRKCPYKVGEVVAVAQSYKQIRNHLGAMARCKINPFGSPREHPGWTNKMFVKAELMHHFVRITEIDFERLQDISDEDCLAEGVRRHGKGTFKVDGVRYNMTKRPRIFYTPRQAFECLIDKVCGKGTWERNHYVYVYTFELVKE